MWYGWRFWLAVAWIPLSCLGSAAFTACFFVGYLCWENSSLKNALSTERSLVVSAQKEVAMMKGVFLAARGEAQQARQEAVTLKKLLREAAPNIVLPHMAMKDIRASALLIVDINDLGTDESGMAYSTTTLVNPYGRQVMYGFKVDERNLDPLSLVLLQGGRIALERQKKFTGGQ